MLQASATNLIAMTLLLGASSAGQAPQHGNQVQNRAAQIEQAAKMRSRGVPLTEAAKAQIIDRSAVQPALPAAPLPGGATATGNKSDAAVADSGSVAAVTATAP